MEQTCVCTDRSHLDDTDRTILSKRAGLFWAQHNEPAVGDYVDFADGTTRRISHIWTFGNPTIQTSDGGSFYLDTGGYCSFSGGLYPGIPIETLTLDTTRHGAVWFFHHDFTTAGGGIHTTMPFAVYRCSLPAN